MLSFFFPLTETIDNDLAAEEFLCPTRYATVRTLELLNHEKISNFWRRNFAHIEPPRYLESAIGSTLRGHLGKGDPNPIKHLFYLDKEFLGEVLHCSMIPRRRGER